MTFRRDFFDLFYFRAPNVFPPVCVSTNLAVSRGRIDILGTRFRTLVRQTNRSFLRNSRSQKRVPSPGHRRWKELGGVAAANVAQNVANRDFWSANESLDLDESTHSRHHWSCKENRFRIIQFFRISIFFKTASNWTIFFSSVWSLKEFWLGINPN